MFFGHGTRAVAAGALACASAVAGCGHVIDARYAPSYAGPFDFKHPPCKVRPFPASASGPEDEVIVRYLGAGGLHIRWRGASLMTGPFFSNPGLRSVLFGRLAPDPGAVERGLAGIDTAGVRAILAGHSHYDHVGDLPLIATDLAPSAKLYVNRSGANMLAAYPSLAERTVAVDGAAGTWIQPEDGSGTRMPFRFMAVPSVHAPQFDHHDWAAGEVEEPWSLPWTEVRTRRLLAGRTHAFVIDLMGTDAEEVRFRIYYQDAANGAGAGKPPDFEGPDAHPYDLAVVCMASSHLVEEHPAWLVGTLRPRHVLVTHYEDFMRSREKPLRFVPFLTNGRANAFLERLRASLASAGQEPRGPEPPVCGPSTPGSTMPLPGEWLTFVIDRGRGATASSGRSDPR